MNINSFTSIFPDFNVSLSQKAIAINSLHLAINKVEDCTEKELIYLKLPLDVQGYLDAFDRLVYSNTGYKNVPKRNGSWDGERGNSFWEPNDLYCPPNKNSYNNIDNKTWKQIKSEHNWGKVCFEKSRPIFTDITVDYVCFEWTDKLSISQLQKLASSKKERENLHMAAFEELSAKWNTSLDNVIKFKNERRLVWHEEPDCYTMRLVYREIHNNIFHWGGIAVAKILL